MAELHGDKVEDEHIVKLLGKLKDTSKDVHF